MFQVLKNGLINRFLKDEKRFFNLFDVILQKIKTIEVIHDNDKQAFFFHLLFLVFPDSVNRLQEHAAS